jgi:ribosomal protein S12 methylthiotransferase accessory factor
VLAPEQLAPLVSPYTGIVRSVVEHMHAPDDARLVNVGCVLAEGDPVIGTGTVDVCGGAHYERGAATAAAICEAAERYSGSYWPDGLPKLPAAALDHAVDPTAFALFHERQYELPEFPFRPFTAATELRWVEGWEVPSAGPAFLPAQLVYLTPAPPDEERVAYPTSSGMAAGRTLADATIGALLELIERDAMMITWYDRLSLPLLTWDDSPELMARDRRFFAPSGLRYAAVDLACFFGIPAVLGVVHGPDGEPGALGVGAACAPTVEEAWRKALAEAFSVRRWARTLALERSDRPRGGGDIRSFDDHLLAYVDHERSAAAAFLDASPERRSVSDVRPLEGADSEERLVAVASRLRDRGIGAYAADVTAPDVRTTGLRVVRALAPGLCALDVLDAARYLGGTRLYHAAFELGLVGAPLSVSDINRDPHPYP